MARGVFFGWSSAVLLIAGVSACSGGHPASPPAPTPTSAKATSAAPPVRALTYPIFEGFELAVNRGTRTRTGQPGPHYWQQWADYTLQAELNPVSKRMTGKGTIRYFNRRSEERRVGKECRSRGAPYH